MRKYGESGHSDQLLQTIEYSNYPGTPVGHSVSLERSVNFRVKARFGGIIYSRLQCRFYNVRICEQSVVGGEEFGVGHAVGAGNIRNAAAGGFSDGEDGLGAGYVP